MSSPFLSLPRELRNQIYHHLWSSTPTLKLSASKDHCLTAWYANRPMALELLRHSAHLGLPIWLVTNKTFFEEGVEEFHLNGLLALNFSGDAKSLPEGTALSPFIARKLHVAIRGAPNTPLGTAAPASLVRELNWDDVARFEELVEGLVKEGKIKTLIIEMVFDRRANVSQTVSLAPLLALAPIVSLSGFRKVEIVVDDHEMGGIAHGTLEPSLLDEIEKLKEDVFGGMVMSVERMEPPKTLPPGFFAPGQVCVWRFVFENK